MSEMLLTSFPSPFTYERLSLRMIKQYFAELNFKSSHILRNLFLRFRAKSGKINIELINSLKVWEVTQCHCCLLLNQALV